LHAIWGLGQLAVKDAAVLAPLPALLDDADPEVRAQIANMLGNFKVAATAEKLVALLQDKENRVRFFAALSLGKIGDKAAFEPLCAMLAENNDADPILRHGGVMGLVGCATAEQIDAKKIGTPVALRGAAAVALRRLKSPLVADFLQDADESVMLDAARAIHDVPIEAAMPALAALTANESVRDPNILSRAINARYRLGGAENAKALAALTANPATPEIARKDALDALTTWADPNPKDRLLNQWRPLPARGADDATAAITSTIAPLLKDSPDSIREGVAKLAGKLSIAAAGEPLFALASDEHAGTNARVEAIKALALLKDSHLAQVAKLATSDKNPKVRSEGLQALATTDPASAVGAIAHVIDAGSIAEKQGAVLALSQIKTPEAEALIGRLLEHLIAGQLPPEIQVDALEAAKKQASPRIKEMLARYEASLPATDDLAKYRVALLGGDADRGRKIFREKAETQCLRCHKCEMGDSQVGPELTHIGAAHDRAYLLESVIYPSKVIAPGFDTVILQLTDGNVVGGRLAGEDASNLKIETFDAKGKPVTTTVAKATVKQRDSAPSPMPPGMGEILTRAELRDVIEYLATRK
jgi:quinoprotein glucose dehydrogenase